jgi:hypothetical protein
MAAKDQTVTLDSRTRGGDASRASVVISIRIKGVKNRAR